MENPINSFIGEVKDTVILVIIIVVGIIILGTIGVALNMQELTSQLINTMSWGLILILAIPSASLIILIIWLMKKAGEFQGNSVYL